MRRALLLLAALGLVGIGGGIALTAPDRVDPARLAGLTGDAARGEAVFRIAGCASCHAAPGADGDARLVLSGGIAFETDFGTFRAPNVSPSPEGIGGWSVEDLANAMLVGVSPDGAHYYPAFPYGSYAKMAPQEIADLHAYMMTLPPSDVESPPHELGFPFSIRRGIGLWKLLYLSPEPVIAVEGETLLRGRYLVEGPGHCGECHTARNALGGPDISRWLAGGPNPDGKGRIPNLTPHETGLTWSAPDIAEYLRSGFTPEYDVAGGTMADVVKNTATLSDEDRAAIAAYLKALPPHPTER